MTTVQFRNFRASDISRPLTVEEIFKRYGAWAGIHDFNFDKSIDEPTITVTGLTPDIWTIQEYGGSLPANFTVKYHKNVLRQALFIYSGADPYYLIVGTDENGYPELRYSTDVIAQTIPKVTPIEADVEVVFRQQTFEDITDQSDPIVWKTVTLYMNGQWITTLSTETTAAVSDMNIGFCAFDTDEVTYTDIVVPELCDTAEFGTLDPGEFVMSGLQRTIEGRYLKFFSRYDGSIRAWKKKQRDNIATIDNLEGIKRTSDIPKLINHARMMGAYIWAEDKDDDLIRSYGHRFQEVNNSMIMTASECFEEAGNTIKRSEEETFTVSTQSRFIPILEPEDRVTIDDEDWVINDYSINASTGRLVASYNCRRYVWSS